MAQKSLQRRGNPLANTEKQLEILSRGDFETGVLPTFVKQLKRENQFPLKTQKLEILQINLGYMCNQVCSHCHVDAGPDRKEIMTEATLNQCLEVMQNHAIATVDLTGGAPEMHPKFRWFVEQIRATTSVKEIIVRSNLTILLANQHYADLPHFFAQHRVHVISSLPFYKKTKTDRQRGEGVFDQSITALQRLNAVGYGKEESNLQLDLVYNPSGAFLPGNQLALETEFKKRLYDDFGIVFNQLFTITNLPISRFLEYLIASENYEEYMQTLVEAFNPNAVKNLMCTNTLSVNWQGELFDCDFNQMLGLKIDSENNHIGDYTSEGIAERNIQVSQHCFGCTAGAGSSCQGSIA